MNVAIGWLSSPGTRLPAAIFLLAALVLADDRNSGYEGLAYDAASDRLLIAKEHSPRALYEIRGLSETLSGRFGLAIRTLNGWTDHGRLASDLSSVEFIPSANEIALLSDESRAIVTVHNAGERMGMQSLRIGEAGHSDTIPQAEGITFDPHGNLYIVSEPNLFDALRRN